MVARLFRHKVLRMLLEEGAIAEGGRPESPRVAPHGIRDTCQPGDPGGCDHAGDRRPLPDPAPITPERMLGEASGTGIISRSDAVHPRRQASIHIFAPLDFLAEVSAHNPDADEKTTLFYGWYSNRTRGYRKQRGHRGGSISYTFRMRRAQERRISRGARSSVPGTGSAASAFARSPCCLR